MLRCRRVLPQLRHCGIRCVSTPAQNAATQQAAAVTPASAGAVAPRTYDVAIVGGGIVGLAVARELQQRHGSHLSIVVVEKEAAVARHQSGHNSGVIHAGLYYKPGSLKAELCRKGAGMMKQFCLEHGISMQETGKLVVATGVDELARLQQLYHRAEENGVPGLEWMSAGSWRDIEPACSGLAAIWSPSTAVTDFAAVCRELARQFVTAGGDLRLGYAARVDPQRRTLSNTLAGEPESVLRWQHLVTCAGLHSDRVAVQAGGQASPRVVPVRGEFLLLRPEHAHLVRSNIYPVPDPGLPFLGVHLTRRVDGSVVIGPNAVLATGREAYDVSWDSFRARDLVDMARNPGMRQMLRQHWRSGVSEVYRSVARRAMLASIQRYVPEIRSLSYLERKKASGVRAALLLPDGTIADEFTFESPSPGVLNVRNAPSPAATSSLAIAQHVVDKLDRVASVPVAVHASAPTS